MAAKGRASSRPESSGHGAAVWYSGREAERYTTANERIQAELTACALRLLGFIASAPKLVKAGEAPAACEEQQRLGMARGSDGPVVLLDLGCGSGLSTTVAAACLPSPAHVIASDIASDMVEKAHSLLSASAVSSVSASVLLADFSQPLPVRPSSCTHAISISAIQWLATSSQRQVFFSSLWRALAAGGRAVLQFYPEDAATAEAFLTSATTMQDMRLVGALVMDMPHACAQRKWFLCLRKPRCATCAASAACQPACPDVKEAAAIAAMPLCDLVAPYHATCAVWWRKHILANDEGDDERVTTGQVSLARSKSMPPYHWLHRQHVQRAHTLIRLQAACARAATRSPERKRRRVSVRNKRNAVDPAMASDEELRLARYMHDNLGSDRDFGAMQRKLPAILAVLHRPGACNGGG